MFAISMRLRFTASWRIIKIHILTKMTFCYRSLLRGRNPKNGVIEPMKLGMKVTTSRTMKHVMKVTQSSSEKGGNLK